MATLTIRMDDDLKRQAEALFGDIGLTTSAAVTVFFKAAVRQNKIPFELSTSPDAAARRDKLIADVASYDAGNLPLVTKSLDELRDMEK